MNQVRRDLVITHHPFLFIYTLKQIYLSYLFIRSIFPYFFFWDGNTKIQITHSTCKFNKSNYIFSYIELVTMKSLNSFREYIIILDDTSFKNLQFHYMRNNNTIEMDIFIISTSLSSRAPLIMSMSSST